MARPDAAPRRQAAEERPARLRLEHGLAVLAVPGALHLAAQHVAHELHAVADAHDRHPQLEQLRVAARRAALVHAVGPAREHDPARVAGLERLRPRPRRQDLRVDRSSRSRRAMSWVYWEPKSRMRMVSLCMDRCGSGIIPSGRDATRGSREDERTGTGQRDERNGLTSRLAKLAGRVRTARRGPVPRVYSAAVLSRRASRPAAAAGDRPLWPARERALRRGLLSSRRSPPGRRCSTR